MDSVAPAKGVKELMGPLLGETMRPIPNAEAEAIAAMMFGVEGKAEMLGGERDQNFRVDTPNGRSFVLKLSHPAELRTVAEFQTAALLHIERKDTELAVPHVIPTLAGEAMGEIAFKGAPRHVRLLSWMPGDMLCRVPTGPAMLVRLGEVAARLDLALADFTDPHGGPDLLWDFASIPRLHQLTGTLEGDMVAPLVDAALTVFENDAMPVMAKLRRQYVHNDLNPHNVLVEQVNPKKITGILDFGDMVQGCLVGELAIACSYHLDVGETPLEGAAACVTGYRAVLPLTEQEMDLLPAFIAARLAMTVLITEWRAKQNPSNGAYILRNNPAARKGLKHLAALAPGQARELLAAPWAGAAA